MFQFASLSLFICALKTLSPHIFMNCVIVGNFCILMYVLLYYLGIFLPNFKSSVKKQHNFTSKKMYPRGTQWQKCYGFTCTTMFCQWFVTLSILCIISLQQWSYSSVSKCCLIEHYRVTVLLICDFNNETFLGILNLHLKWHQNII